MVMQRSRSRRPRRQPKNLFWTRASSSNILPASSAGSVYNISSGLDTALDRNVNNWTIERLILDLQLTVPAGTAAGRAYSYFLGITLVEDDAVAAGVYPEPFGDNVSWMWIRSARVFADHTVPASYASPAVPHSASHIQEDIRNKRRLRQHGQSLYMVGYHDNGLSANPTINITFSALWNVR